MENNVEDPIEDGLPAVEDEGDQGGDAPVEPPRKRARFQASKDANSKWDMPQELADYVREALTEYIPEKTLKDKVLEEIQSLITLRNQRNWTPF